MRDPHEDAAADPSLKSRLLVCTSRHALLDDLAITVHRTHPAGGSPCQALDHCLCSPQQTDPGLLGLLQESSSGLWTQSFGPTAKQPWLRECLQGEESPAADQGHSSSRLQIDTGNGPTTQVVRLAMSGPCEFALAVEATEWPECRSQNRTLTSSMKPRRSFHLNLLEHIIIIIVVSDAISSYSIIVAFYL